MPLTGVYGKGGSGKNTIVAYLKMKKFKKIKTYVNFTMTTPNTEKIDSMSLFDIPTIEEPQLLIYDEAYTEGLDERASMSLNNQIQSYLLFQARKNNFSIISITQLNILDIRWRSLEEHIILCHDRAIYTKDLKPYKGDFKYTFMNLRSKRDFVLKYKTAQKVFPLFDTKEKILPKNFALMKNRLEMQNPENKNKVVNEIVEKLLSENPTNEDLKNHMWLRDKLLEYNFINLNLEPYVYARLKLQLEKGIMQQKIHKENQTTKQRLIEHIQLKSQQVQKQ